MHHNPSDEIRFLIFWNMRKRRQFLQTERESWVDMQDGILL